MFTTAQLTRLIPLAYTGALATTVGDLHEGDDDMLAIIAALTDHGVGDDVYESFGQAVDLFAEAWLMIAQLPDVRALQVARNEPDHWYAFDDESELNRDRVARLDPLVRRMFDASAATRIAAVTR